LILGAGDEAAFLLASNTADGTPIRKRLSLESCRRSKRNRYRAHKFLQHQALCLPAQNARFLAVIIEIDRAIRVPVDRVHLDRHRSLHSLVIAIIASDGCRMPARRSQGFGKGLICCWDFPDYS
jgi:hypothetical protein